MLYALYGTVFLLIAAGVWLVSGTLLRSLENRWQRSVSSVTNSLDALFMTTGARTIRLVLGGCVIAGMVAGFLLPGNLKGLNRLVVEEAAQLNLRGRYERALTVLSRVQSEDSPLVRNERGVAYLGMGNAEDAMVEFEAAIKLYPEFAVVHANLATAFAMLGRGQDAAFEWRKARELSKYPLRELDIYGRPPGLTSGLPLRLICMVLGAMFGLWLPSFVITRLRNRRMSQFDDLLPDALLMASNALRAGFSLVQALQLIAREVPRPVSQEFGLVVKENQLGRELDESLWGLTERMATDDARIFVSSVVILRETGGNMTEIFENIAYTIRERKMVKEKIKTMTAEGKAQAYILTALPLLLGLLLNKMNPEAFSLMYTTFMGWVIMIFIVIWGGIGFFFMWKSVQVKV